MLELITSINTAFLSIMPPLAVIVLWALISAAFSMFVYAKLSPQTRLNGLKKEHKIARHNLIHHDGTFAEMQELIFKDLGIALKQMGLIFPAFVISVIPVFALMFCLFVLYGYSLPQKDEKIAITVTPANAQVRWIPYQAVKQTAPGTWDLSWPQTASPVRIEDEYGRLMLKFPTPFAIPEVTKPSWLTTLFPNPNGDLDATAPIDSIQLALPSRYYTHFGPDWMRGFEFWYILALLISSLFIKIRFRII